MSYSIVVLPATVSRITLYGVNDSAFYFLYLYNTDMIRDAILSIVFIIPVEKDDVSAPGLVAVVLPKLTVPEPLDADGTACKPGDHAIVQIAALVGASGNKAGTPIHPTLKAVPGPIGLPAHIAKLGEGHHHDLLFTHTDAVQGAAPHTAVFFDQ